MRVYRKDSCFKTERWALYDYGSGEWLTEDLALAGRDRASSVLAAMRAANRAAREELERAWTDLTGEPPVDARDRDAP